MSSAKIKISGTMKSQSLLFIIFFLVWSFLLNAQTHNKYEENSAIENHFKTIEFLLDNQKYLDARRSFAKLDSEVQQNLIENPCCELYVDLVKIGRIQQQLGEMEKALNYFQKSLRVFENNCVVDFKKLADLYSNIGESYATLGYSGESVEFYKKSLAIYASTYKEDSPEVINLLIKLGTSYYLRLDTANAGHYFRKALKLIPEDTEIDSMQLRLAHIYINLGRIALVKEGFDEALVWFNKTMVIRARILPPDDLLMAGPLINIGIVWKNKKEFEKALKYYHQALNIRKNKLPKGHPDLATPYKNLADLYRLRGDLETASMYYDTTIIILSQSLPEGHIYITETVEDMGEVFLTLYKNSKQEHFLDLADTAYYKAWQLIISQQRNTRSKSSKEQFISDLFSVCEGSIDVEYLKNEINLDKIWNYFESSKTYLLLEAIQENNALHFSGISDSLINKESEIRMKISEVQKQLYFLRSKRIEITNPEYLETEATLLHIKDNYNELIQNFEKNNPEYYNLKFNLKIASIPETQATLNNNQVLIEYFVGENSLYAFVIHRDYYNVIMLPIPTNFEELVSSCRNGIFRFYTGANKNSDIYEKGIRAYVESSTELYKILIEPLTDFLAPEITIIPDGCLSNLPFEILLERYPTDITSFETFPFLIKKHSFSYCYSATLLKLMMNKKHSNNAQNDLLGIAPFYEGENLPITPISSNPLTQRDRFRPLQYSGEELARIKHAVGGDARFMFGSDCTKRNFLSVMANYRVLHLATHGMANESDGDFSYLAFFPVDSLESSTFLFGSELYNSTINADLVLLSACESGIGQYKRGEGVYSMSRAFAYAGAKSIITSLWSVNDRSTMEIMDFFYQEIKKGTEKHIALTKAKLHYMETNPGSASNPFYWGAFIAIGNMQPIDFN